MIGLPLVARGKVREIYDASSAAAPDRLLLVASDRKVMQGQRSSRLGRAVVGVTTVTMFAAALAFVAL